MDSTMDPEDWEDFRKLAHQMVDVMIDRMRRLEDQPVWTAPPAELIEKWTAERLPKLGIGESGAFQRFCEEILPYGNGSWHPRFLGWVQGSGVPLGMMADMLASGLNSHLAGFNTAPKWIEFQVIAWLKEMMGFEETASGLLTTGGSMANILSLHVARHHQQEKRGADVQRWRLYASDQVHGWIWKGLDLLGIGRDTLRVIPSDDQGCISVETLVSAIEADLQDQLIPWCLIANAGTVHTGAIDPLESLLEVAERFQLWLHVDGAFGALARLLPEYLPQLGSLPRVDSIALDLHKWMYLPFDIGCMLFREESNHLATFASSQVYMTATDRGLLAGGVPLADRGIELTRSFRALKAWMCLQAYGSDRFASSIAKNIRHARMLASMIDASTDFERLADVPLHIVCFRHRGRSGDNPVDLDRWNLELLLRLQEDGRCVLSSTRIGSRFALRACFSNHRTDEADVQQILALLRQIADGLNVDWSRK